MSIASSVPNPRPDALKGVALHYQQLTRSLNLQRGAASSQMGEKVTSHRTIIYLLAIVSF